MINLKVQQRFNLTFKSEQKIDRLMTLKSVIWMKELH